MRHISIPILFVQSEGERAWNVIIDAWPVILFFATALLPTSWQTQIISMDYLAGAIFLLFAITAITCFTTQVYLNSTLEVLKQGITIKQQGILYKMLGKSSETEISWGAIKGIAIEVHEEGGFHHTAYKVVLKTSHEQEYCLYFYSYWFSGKKKHLHNFIGQLENFREGCELAQNLRFKLGQL